MLPVIPEFTGTEYNAVGFWLSVGILALLIALAGYIAGRSAAKRFGGKKATTALIFSSVALGTSAALICFFWSIGNGYSWKRDLHYYALRLYAGY